MAQSLKENLEKTLSPDPLANDPELVKLLE